MVKYFTKAKFGSGKTMFTPFNKKSTAMRDVRLTKRNEVKNVSIKIVKATPQLRKRLKKSPYANVFHLK